MGSPPPCKTHPRRLSLPQPGASPARSMHAGRSSTVTGITISIPSFYDARPTPEPNFPWAWGQRRPPAPAAGLSPFLRLCPPFTSSVPSSPSATVSPPIHPAVNWPPVSSAHQRPLIAPAPCRPSRLKRAKGDTVYKGTPAAHSPPLCPIAGCPSPLAMPHGGHSPYILDRALLLPPKCQIPPQHPHPAHKLVIFGFLSPPAPK